jgi:hypothetical protein
MAKANELGWLESHDTIGTKVARFFYFERKNQLFKGEVIAYLPESRPGKADELYRIVYEDNDKEDYNREQLEVGKQLFYDKFGEGVRGDGDGEDIGVGEGVGDGEGEGVGNESTSIAKEVTEEVNGEPIEVRKRLRAPGKSDAISKRSSSKSTHVSSSSINSLNVCNTQTTLAGDLDMEQDSQKLMELDLSEEVGQKECELSGKNHLEDVQRWIPFSILSLDQKATLYRGKEVYVYRCLFVSYYCLYFLQI